MGGDHGSGRERTNFYNPGLGKGTIRVAVVVKELIAQSEDLSRRVAVLEERLDVVCNGSVGGERRKSDSDSEG